MAPAPKKQTASAPSSGENYSVDEMMGHLKKGGRQKQQSDRRPEGELVTREDGTQVVKVRRRKRRSKQPPKKQTSQTNKMLNWGILGSVVGIIVLMAVGSVFIIAKYNGRKFKATTESTLCELSGASETTLTQLSVTPVSAKADKAELTWDKHSVIKNASFSKIQANIKATSFFTNKWTGEDVVAHQGTVHLQRPLPSIETNAPAQESPYQFETYRCDKLKLVFGSDKKSPMISGLQGSLRQLPNFQYQTIFHNGTLKLNHWPELNLSYGIIALNPESANIEAKLKANSTHNGELKISGNISKNTQEPTILAVKAKNYPIQELLGKDLGRMIQGSLQSDSGSLSFDYSKASSDSLSFILPFSSTNIHCEGFPMFKTLNNLTRKTAFSRPTFNRSSGTITRTSEGLSLYNLELINNNLIIIQGHLTVDAKGKLSGILSVAIPQSQFDDNPGLPFTGPVSGMYQVEVNLGGNIKTPNDNLFQLIKQATPARPKPVSPTFKEVSPVQPQPDLPITPKPEDFDAIFR